MGSSKAFLHNLEAKNYFSQDHIQVSNVCIWQNCFWANYHLEDITSVCGERYGIFKPLVSLQNITVSPPGPMFALQGPSLVINMSSD